MTGVAEIRRPCDCEIDAGMNGVGVGPDKTMAHPNGAQCSKQQEAQWQSI
jgi:hypothetical protein